MKKVKRDDQMNTEKPENEISVFEKIRKSPVSVVILSVMSSALGAFLGRVGQIGLAYTLLILTCVLIFWAGHMFIQRHQPLSSIDKVTSVRQSPPPLLAVSSIDRINDESYELHLKLENSSDYAFTNIKIAVFTERNSFSMPHEGEVTIVPRGKISLPIITNQEFDRKLDVRITAKAFLRCRDRWGFETFYG